MEAAHDGRRAQKRPVPEDVADLPARLWERLDVLAALRIVGALESTTAEAGAVAAHMSRADDQPRDTIATCLGLAEPEARARLHRSMRRY
ncbi:hypothetical protein ACFZAT_20680 [Streptomyces sp. NPDC008163]|uniref:hypothetical protein n=1 Tax=Streptomyces sp. NPDC008163 TaxID=3364818 RepID=UPI0036EF6DBA